MDITKTNFKFHFGDIKNTINNADFIAIDCEFSGLNISSENNINPYDSFEQYYYKLKTNISNFLVLQLGFSAFRYEEKEKKFKHKTFNFYLFPRPLNRSIPDQRFLCQVSSIEFLSSHNFDFNKVFKEGITYLNINDESKYKEVLEEKYKNKSSPVVQPANSIIPIPTEDKPFINEVMSLIQKFLKSDNQELKLPQCNSFRRRLIYQTANEKFSDKVTLETRILENKDRVLYVQRPDNAEQIAEKQRQRHENSLNELEDAVGFSRVIRLISESGKLIVGHNLCLDLLHIIDKFMVPLPDEFEEFKSCANTLFPNIIDTKVMASCEQFSDLIEVTVLTKMLETFQRKPFEIPTLAMENEGKSYKLDDHKQHEAGFDAFLTGICFLTMANYLDKSDYYFLPDSKIIKPFLNKIFVLKIQDCAFINLVGREPNLKRDHVLYITFPKDWKTYDITQLFSPFGNIHIAWLNDTSAYVALYKHDKAALALKTLSQSTSYKVMSYAEHQMLYNSQSHATQIFSNSRKKREADLISSFECHKKRRRDTNFGESSSNDSQKKTETLFDESSSNDSPKRPETLFDENLIWE